MTTHKLIHTAVKLCMGNVSKEALSCHSNLSKQKHIPNDKPHDVDHSMLRSGDI